MIAKQGLRDEKNNPSTEPFAASLYRDKAKEFSQIVRGHGAIKSMHWILDVVFNEDKSRLRNGESTQNFGFLRIFVIRRLKRDTSKGSLQGKRKRAAWSTEFLEKLLFGQRF